MYTGIVEVSWDLKFKCGIHEYFTWSEYCEHMVLEITRPGIFEGSIFWVGF